MKPLFPFLTGCLCALSALGADSTIDSGKSFAWSANLGWTQWRPSTVAGVSVGRYVCSGYIYSANTGWIHLGGGHPVNGIQYTNTGTDYGVNFVPSTIPGYAALRGLAYGENIGWLNFENSGDPRVDLITGKLTGYIWSANCGWITLGNATVQGPSTTSITPAEDTDGDGIADPFERQYFQSLTVANATSDFDGDGRTDAQEYLEGTGPLLPDDGLRVLTIVTNRNGSETTLRWTSNPARLYVIEACSPVAGVNWQDVVPAPLLPDPGSTTVVTLTDQPAVQRFFRIRAVLPLAQ